VLTLDSELLKSEKEKVEVKSLCHNREIEKEKRITTKQNKKVKPDSRYPLLAKSRE